MEAPRPAATKLHRKLKNRMYRFAEKHSLTGFEAAGIMFALATEVMALALVRDGLLQGGPDWAEEGEDPEQDAPVPAVLTSDAEAKLQAIAARDRRINQLENALRVMAELALSEVKEHQARLAETVITGTTDEELRANEHEVLRKSLQLAGRETRITDLLHRFCLTLPTQEPQP
jgi:hypothetical protein